MFQRTSLQRGRHARDGGATAVEYGLILSGVVLATAAAIIGLKPILASALGSASGNQAILSDGSTASPPTGGTGTGGPTSSTAAPSASSASPSPTTATPTPTTATPTPTTATPTPTTATPTPTPTPTTATPTPTPSQTALSRQGTWFEAYTLPNNGTYSGCSITSVPTLQSWQLGTCGYTTKGTDRFTYDPFNSAPVGTVITIVWTISVPGPDITVTRTFVIGA